MSFGRFVYRTREEESHDGELLQVAAIRPGLGSPRSHGSVDEGLCLDYERIVCQEALERAYHKRFSALTAHAVDAMDEEWFTCSYRFPRGARPEAWINGPAKGDQEIAIPELRKLLGARLFRCIDRPGVHFTRTNDTYRIPHVRFEGATQVMSHLAPTVVPGNAVMHGWGWIGLVEDLVQEHYVVRMTTISGTEAVTRIARGDAARYLYELRDSREVHGIFHFPFRFPEHHQEWEDLAKRTGRTACESPKELRALLSHAFPATS